MRSHVSLQWFTCLLKKSKLTSIQDFLSNWKVEKRPSSWASSENYLFSSFHGDRVIALSKSPTFEPNFKKWRFSGCEQINEARCPTVTWRCLLMWKIICTLFGGFCFVLQIVQCLVVTPAGIVLFCLVNVTFQDVFLNQLWKLVLFFISILRCFVWFCWIWVFLSSCWLSGVSQSHFGVYFVLFITIFCVILKALVSLCYFCFHHVFFDEHYNLVLFFFLPPLGLFLLLFLFSSSLSVPKCFFFSSTRAS